MEEKKGFKKINMEELDNISGGELIEVDGVYWAVGDSNGTAFYCPIGYRDIGDAVDAARQRGWNTKVMTQEEFKKRYGSEFEPFGPIK